ncbi:Rad4 transglutaminase-like domain-containing protein, partial [Aspergillus desertorum]
MARPKRKQSQSSFEGSGDLVSSQLECRIPLLSLHVRTATSSKTALTNTGPTRSESSYPVFWVEAFNEAFQKWVVIDPMVTKTLAKPHRLEPPATDPYNLLSYVVAFEEDASARDVTRRYTKVFNAKTRKLRIESTRNGEAWWKRVLQHFEKPFLEDRDELEIAELTAKTAAEPMPRNVQDFKDHPIYALERHLRRNEVIFPKRVTGHVSLGKAGGKGQTEPIYRRSDVHTLRSANKWYRLGRDIKVGEQPLKRIPARNRATATDDDEESEETALYAFFQTELYKPPPVVQGRIPKNAFGNLDVYVPSMVPPGGIHIRHLDAARAARILGIDYADAVTGFSFKGRHGTAIIQGVVVADEYREAVEEVLNALEEEKLRSKQEERAVEVLRAWKHLLLKLRIAERVKGYAIEGEADDEASGLDQGEVDEGGGFLPESDAEVVSPRPNAGPPEVYAARDEEMGGGFLPESDAEDHPPMYKPRRFKLSDGDQRDQSIPAPVDDLGGGFVPEGNDPNPTISERPRKTKAPPPRYDLVVVPSYAAIPAVGQRSTIVQPQNTNQAPPPSTTPEALGDSIDEPIMVASSVNDSASASVEILSRAPSQIQSRAQSVEVVSQPSEHEAEENEGSLLSEDPEDEDAVPEWLMS